MNMTWRNEGDDINIIKYEMNVEIIWKYVYTMKIYNTRIHFS